MKKVTLGMILLLPMTANAWNGNATAYQSASGYNSANATSISSGNGSAFNAAGSSTLVGGFSSTSVGMDSISAPIVGSVTGTQFNAAVGDVKQVNTWAVSNNSGNGYGSSQASGSASGYGHLSGFVRDLARQRCSVEGATANASGYIENNVNANSFASDTDPSDSGGIQVSEHGAIAGAEANISGFAGFNGTHALAFDSKDITTFADTYETGVGSSYGFSTGRVSGNVFESTLSQGFGPITGAH